MSAVTKAPAAGDSSGRPARAKGGNTPGGSVLSLNTGAGPEQLQENRVVSQRHSTRPVRFEDPERNAAYWARIDRIVATAPPLSDEQRAVIRTAFSQPRTQEAA